ncbi:MAG: acyl-CoA dehydrogenase family protein [Desulfomonile tiedjei]|nr:acyl-CoA dehydrogenase family protein [Desulfomonile tiedjei]
MERGLFSEEHTIFRSQFQKFLDAEVAPYYDQWEQERIVPKSAWLKMGANGFLCPWVDEKYGGSDAGLEYSVIMAEEMNRRDFVGFMASLHTNIVVPYIDSFGSEEQKQKWLPGCVTGEIITAIAMTEPNAGSDLAAIRTKAIKDGNDYIINGQKTFISNGLNSNLVVVAAKTDPSAGFKGISLICVEEGTPGFFKGRKLNKMGIHSNDTAELFFDDCRVPVSHLLGEEGKGFYYMMQKLQRERLFAVIGSQIMAEAMLDLTIKYCKERTIFGKPVSSFQHNTFKIAEMATEIELGRTFVDTLIREHMDGIDITKKVSMAKAWIPEMVNRVAYQCLQLHGGYGYMEEYPICRFARDVRVHTIYAGSTEVMKTVVGKMLGL